MRLTVTLDYDVVQLLEHAARARGRSKKHIVNEALRQLLTGIAPAQPVPEETVTRPVAEPPVPRPADRSDQDALNAALATYFGLPALPPRLYLVKSER
ncbi:CopG family transcriptional regulator [Nocardia sp. BMG111209]|uniref:ribbon-helix-helix domain-containing protein n=1 Tax=Nocardia sp. BMG111209 TaxID=1160137 RepID=UPI0003A8BF23|nr:CopG family transcriptional regulator [Nocardia sp. BMG111209]